MFSSDTPSSDLFDEDLHIVNANDSRHSGQLKLRSASRPSHGNVKSTDEVLLGDVKQKKSSATARQSPRHRRSRNLIPNAHQRDSDEGERIYREQDDALLSPDQSKRLRSELDKIDDVFDPDVHRLPESPAIKRRRTRSSTRRSRQLSPGPEVDELLLRQLLDTSTTEEREEILAAVESPKGRRKLHKLFERNKSTSSSRRKKEPRNSHMDGDIEWLGTAYDGVEEVALTPSPKTKRKGRHSRLMRSAEIDWNRKAKDPPKIERIDTSESPERVMRRRSGRLSRNSDQASARRNTAGGDELFDSSPSPEPKQRRSRRLARVEELPPSDGTVEADDSENSDSSGDSDIDSPRRGKRAAKRSKGRTRSHPLPRFERGSMSERRRKGIHIRSRKRPSSKSVRRKPRSSSAVSRGAEEEPKDSSLRRSKRLRKSKISKRSVIDLDADDEVLEEGSADDSKRDGEMNYSDVENPDEVEDEDDSDEMEIEGMEEGDDDEDDEEDEDDDYEDRAWKEDFKRRQIKRRGRRNVRRKRTQPRDVFRTEGEFLTAREQKERLDFLVKQSEEIANHLHDAMGDTSKKPSGTSENVGGTKADASGDHRDASSIPARKEEQFVPPSGSGCELQPHQKAGVDWLLTLDSQGLNAILADEMGLGKTIQAVSFLASLVVSGSRGPHLVVAPKSVCQHWADEVRKWYPKELSVVTHIGKSERLEKLKYILEEDNFDILITSFDHALIDLFTKKRRPNLSWEHVQVLRAFRKVEFEYLIVDEAHRLKNDVSKTNIAIRGYDLAQRRLLLTGTPLSNNLQELWSLMNVLNPRIFSSKATFETWFSAPFASKTKKRAKVSLTPAEQSVVVDRLHSVIRPFFRRRVRADVCPSFTSADEVIIRCPLSALQKAVLSHLQRRAKASEVGITNAIMGMRAASNHPYIFSEALYDSFDSKAREKMVVSSGKFVFLHYALPWLVTNGHRVLIFSQFKRVLDFIEDLLILLEIKFKRLDGETSSDDRTNALYDFNREGSDIPVFLLTTRAGGVGLNLQTADTVILFDSDWNPSADLQAVSRIQRIGQKKTVHILRLVTENSIDDLIVETARHKLRTQNVAVGAGKFDTSKGATLDSRRRQKDLEELLIRLEAQNYSEDQAEKAAATSQENGSPAALSPKRTGRSSRDRRFEEWGRQLLRKGEDSLPSITSSLLRTDLPSDTTGDHIPHWLKKDADLHSAAKALKCTDESAAGRVYEESLQMKLSEGQYSRKDRATRARRANCVIYISDADSENDSGNGDDSDSKDPSVNISSLDEEEDEADHIIPTDAAGQEKKTRKGKNSGEGIVKAWAGRSGNDVPQGQQGQIALPSNGSTKGLTSSKSVSQAFNIRDDKNHPSAPVQNNAQRNVMNVTDGTKELPCGTNLRGIPFSVANSTSQQSHARPTQKRVPNPTANLKRLIHNHAVSGKRIQGNVVGAKPPMSRAAPSQSQMRPRVPVFVPIAPAVLTSDGDALLRKPAVTKTREKPSVVDLVSPSVHPAGSIREQPTSMLAIDVIDVNSPDDGNCTTLVPVSSLNMCDGLEGVCTEETVSLRGASLKKV